MLNPDSQLARPHPQRAIAARAEWPVESCSSTVSGAAVQHVGLACPLMHPDQVVLYRADSIEDPD